MAEARVPRGAAPLPRRPSRAGWLETLGRVKPMELILRDAEDREHGLERSMGTVSLTAFGVAAIIGAGIFVLTGVAAKTSAGPAIVLSYVAAGITSALAALCYAELASTVPIAGSAYTYSYAVLGEIIAWIIGWDLVLEYGVGAATVASGWSGYFKDFLKSAFGVTLPTSITTPPFGVSSPGVVNLPAAVILLLLTGLLILGTSESSKVNNIIVAVKLLVVGFFIVVGATHINSGNWHPFMPFGVSGVLSGASLIFFAYIGFDQISTAAEEVKDPQRTMPRGILLSLGICTLLYVLVCLVLTGMVHYSTIDTSSPVSHAMLQVGTSWAATVISVGALAGLTTVLLVLIFGQTRVLFSMSRDGLLPGVFSRVHQSFRTPYITTAIVGVLIAVIAALTPIDVLAEMVNIGTLAAFTLVSIAVWRLRHAQPDLPRGFRVPWVPVIPILSVLASVALMTQLHWETWVRFVVWLAIGFVVYFVYSRRHSRLSAEDTATGRSA